MLKRMIAMAAVCGLLLLCAFPAAAETGPYVSSEAYIVMDADSGQILLAKNADEELSPASVTKIMTLGLACQKANGDWSAALTVSHDDVYSLYGTGSSHIALAEGETVTLNEMLYATEMASANDAANVLAEYIGGSMQGGVDAMNAQAAALGLEHTHFSNAHGISDDGHYTSAHDLAIILQWAMQQPGFSTLFFNTDMYTMEGTNVHPETRYFSIQDSMRRQDSKYYIPEITGSKIGFTSAARYTYACTAEKDGVNLICTVLKSELKTDKYADVKTLLDYSFSHFRPVEVSSAAENIPVTIQGGGDVIGTLEEQTPSVSVLLDTALDESAVSLDTQTAAYTLGCAAPTATYSISGQGVQEDSTVAASLPLSGLSELIASQEEAELPAAAAEAKVIAAERTTFSLPLWLAVPAVALCVAFLAIQVRSVRPASRKKRLRKTRT